MGFQPFSCATSFSICNLPRRCVWWLTAHETCDLTDNLWTRNLTRRCAWYLTGHEKGTSLHLHSALLQTKSNHSFVLVLVTKSEAIFGSMLSLQPQCNAICCTHACSHDAMPYAALMLAAMLQGHMLQSCLQPWCLPSCHAFPEPKCLPRNASLPPLFIHAWAGLAQSASCSPKPACWSKPHAHLSQHSQLSHWNHLS